MALLWSIFFEVWLCILMNSLFRCPHFPLLETKGRNGGYNFYPMEVCIVSDNQRVKTHQQTPRQAQEMIKVHLLECAVFYIWIYFRSALLHQHFLANRLK